MVAADFSMISHIACMCLAMRVVMLMSAVTPLVLPSLQSPSKRVLLMGPGIRTLLMVGCLWARYLPSWVVAKSGRPNWQQFFSSYGFQEPHGLTQLAIHDTASTHLGVHGLQMRSHSRL